MLTEMSDRPSVPNSLIDVALLILYAVIMVIVVLAADWFALSLLNLQTDIGTWVTLLISEAFVMLLFGAAGWGFREFEHIPVGWKDTRIIHLRFTPRYPWFWLSVGIAGVILIIICTYVVTVFYEV